MPFVHSVGCVLPVARTAHLVGKRHPLASASSPRTTLRAGAGGAASSPRARLSRAAADHESAESDDARAQPPRTRRPAQKWGSISLSRADSSQPYGERMRGAVEGTGGGTA